MQVAISIFLGSDTAPHFNKDTINTHGCDGIFNTPSSFLSYVTILEEMNTLKHLQSFCSETVLIFIIYL